MLAVLDLDELSDLPALDRQYKRLIKQLHPDVNPDAREWAHDRSQAVITAARVLREYLERVGPRTVPLRRDPRPTGGPERDATYATRGSAASTAGATAATASGPRRTESAFQMIDGRRVNYALPIKHIVKIIGVRDPGVHRGAPGPYCCLDGEIYPLHNLEGEDLPWEEAAFVVLLKSPRIRVGIVLPRDARFGGIESYRTSELLRASTSRSSHGIWIRHDMKFYLCPAELLPDFTREPVCG